MLAVHPGLLLYLAGIAVALLLTDGSARVRLALALLWPIGPAAFIGTVALLLAASVIAFPMVWAIVAALGAAAWLVLL
jgi:hypothetical protein